METQTQKTPAQKTPAPQVTGKRKMEQAQRASLHAKQEARLAAFRAKHGLGPTETVGREERGREGRGRALSPMECAPKGTTPAMLEAARLWLEAERASKLAAYAMTLDGCGDGDWKHLQARARALRARMVKLWTVGTPPHLAQLARWFGTDADRLINRHLLDNPDPHDLPLAAQTWAALRDMREAEEVACGLKGGKP